MGRSPQNHLYGSQKIGIDRNDKSAWIRKPCAFVMEWCGKMDGFHLRSAICLCALADCSQQPYLSTQMLFQKVHKGVQFLPFRENCPGRRGISTTFSVINGNVFLNQFAAVCIPIGK